MTSQYSIYIPIGITYRNYKAEYFAAYIDSGSGTCLCKSTCFPKEYHETLPQKTGLDISNNPITLNYGISKPQILIGSFLIKCPPFYFHDTGLDVLLGNNFLQLFHKVLFDTVQAQIHFKTPCGHWIVVSRLKAAYARSIPITFQPRTAKRGEIGYKENPKIDKIDKTTPMLKFEKQIQQKVMIQIKYIEEIVETIRKKIEQCYTENPLKFWDKNQEYAEIKLKDETKEIRVKPMRYNPADKEEFRKQIKELLEIPLIRESNSPHSSPAFMVRNHAEIVRNKPRMVVNYKQLNKATIFDGYFLPHKETLINMTKKKKIYSKFDCKSGFWQIKMHPDSIQYTAFSTPQGHYEWLVMPFGLKNAPQIFQRKMDKIFKDYPFIYVYIDDILIASDSIPEHLEHLNIFIDLCIQHGIGLSEKKSKIGLKEIEFLGLLIGNDGIKLQAHMIEKIQNFPDKLQDKKQLQRFLGVLNYASDFIHNLADKRKELQKLLKKDVKYEFSENHIAIVQRIKRDCKNLPLLSLPSDDDNLILETDASEDVWGAVLKTENNQLCRYASGTFTSTEKRYHINEKELLAVVNGCKKFYYFLLPRKFILRIDNTSVKGFIKNNIEPLPQNKRLLRWQGLLAEFEFEIEIVKTTNNILADFLTREGRPDE